MNRIAFAFFILACLIVPQAVTGQAPVAVKPYDRIDAGRDAYAHHESIRRWEFEQQLGLNELMRQRATFGSFGWDPYYGADAGAFDFPWRPYSAGGIWSIPFLRPIHQPIGRREVFIAPNRWESHPIYSEPQRSSGPREF